MSARIHKGLRSARKGHCVHSHRLRCLIRTECVVVRSDETVCCGMPTLKVRLCTRQALPRRNRRLPSVRVVNIDRFYLTLWELAPCARIEVKRTYHEETTEERISKEMGEGMFDGWH